MNAPSDDSGVPGTAWRERRTALLTIKTMSITNANGNWTAAPFNGRDVYDNYAGEVGVRARCRPFWLESLQRCLRKGLICESQFG